MTPEQRKRSIALMPAAQGLAAHAASVRRVACALLMDDAAAADVSQDALLVSLTSRTRPRHGLGPWLAGVSRRLAGRRLRSDQLRRLMEKRAAVPEALPSSADHIARLEMEQRLVEQVRHLPDDQAQVLYLRFWDDLPPRAIAERLGLPLGTVKSRQKRALMELRRQLDQTSSSREEWLGALLPLALPNSSLSLSTESGLAFKTSSSTATTLGTSLLVKKSLLLALVSLVISAVVTVLAKSGGSDQGIARVEERKVSKADVEEVNPDGQNEGQIASPAGDRVAQSRTEFASLSVRVHSGTDASGVEGVEVLLSPGPSANRPFPEGVESARTDSRGLVQFSDLVQGSYSVSSARSNAMPLELVAAEVRSVDMEIEEALSIRGVVLDPKGNPAPGADVILQQNWVGSRWQQIEVIASTDRKGVFRIEGVPRSALLGARHWSSGPSPLVTLETWSQTQPRKELLTLRLRGAGHSFGGRVVDNAGFPIFHAMVLIEESNSAWDYAKDELGNSVGRPRRLALWTDDRGEFQAEGLGSHSLYIVVHALKFAPVGIYERASEEFRSIVLEDAPVVEGRVTDTEGQPIAGARISGGSPLAGVPPVPQPQATTDQDGRYRLSGLMVGRSTLRCSRLRQALLLAGAADQDGEWATTGELKQGVSLEAGERRILNFTFSDNRVIAGHLIDPSGSPISGARLFLDDSGSIDAQCMTNGQGRFFFGDLDADDYELKIFGDAYDVLVSLRSGLQPGGPEIEVEWRDYNQIGSVRGRIVDLRPDADASGGLRYRIWRTDRMVSHEGDLVDDAFQVEDLPKGDYRLTLLLNNAPIGFAPLFRVQVGLETDLGVIRLEAPASLLVRLEFPAGQELPRGSVLAESEDFGEVIAMEKQEGVFRAVLPPGIYGLRVSMRGFASSRESIEVRSGESLDREVMVHAGVHCQLRLEYPEGFPRPNGMARIRIRDLEGHTLFEKVFARHSVTAVEVELAPGTYEVLPLDLRIEKEGLRGTFVVPDVAAADSQPKLGGTKIKEEISVRLY